MTQSVLVIHGAGEPRRRNGKIYWEPLLQPGLGARYAVHAPRMPRPTKPSYRSWAKRVAELIAGAKSPVMVGHSFGASVLLKYLSEAAKRPPVAGLFLVSTPFWGSDFPEFALKPDFAAGLRGLEPIHFYHSRDDSEIPLEHCERYRRALPHAVVRILNGRGHEFDQPEFPELVSDIRALDL